MNVSFTKFFSLLIFPIFVLACVDADKVTSVCEQFHKILIFLVLIILMLQMRKWLLKHWNSCMSLGLWTGWWNHCDPYWTSRENSLELIELSSINIVSLVLV